MIRLTTKRKKLAYELEFTAPNGLEFDLVDWNVNQTNMFINTPWKYRLIADSLEKAPVLKQLVNNVIAEQYTLLDTLWADEYFSQVLWNGYTQDELKSNTEPYYEVCKDLPGFRTSIHVDHRRAVTAGMLFFNTTNDPNQNTIFYNNDQGATPVHMNSSIGKGWYSANYHNSWHFGGNRSDTIRYSIKFGLHLRKGGEPVYRVG